MISSDANLGGDDIQLGANTNSGILEYTGAAETIDNQFRIGDNNTAAGRVGAGSIINNGSGTLTFSNAAFNRSRAATEARTLSLDGTSDEAMVSVASIPDATTPTPM